MIRIWSQIFNRWVIPDPDSDPVKSGIGTPLIQMMLRLKAASTPLPTHPQTKSCIEHMAQLTYAPVPFKSSHPSQGSIACMRSLMLFILQFDQTHRSKEDIFWRSLSDG